MLRIQSYIMWKKLQILFLLLFSTVGFLVGAVYFYNPEIILSHWPKPTAQPVTVQAEQEIEVAEPSRIVIPSVGVEVDIELVGQDANGRMDVPKNVSNAGWWQYGAKPGGKGSAVIAGHVDTPDGQLGIFYKLDQLKPGDTIVVYDQDGKQHVFEVAFLQIYPYDEFPVDVIFERTDKKRLNLITCSGNFDLSEQSYEERLVVFAEAIE
jgi:sortase A